MVEGGAEILPRRRVRGSGSNLTLFIDVSSWFKDSSGNAIDPTSSQNASTIENQIKQSFKVFEDDGNGIPDSR